MQVIVGKALGPGAGNTHLNRPLTDFAISWAQDSGKFVSTRAVPITQSATKTNAFGKYDLKDFISSKSEERADGSQSVARDFGLDTDTFNCKPYAVHVPIGDQAANNEDEWVDLEETATQLVTNDLLIQRERQFANTVLKTGVWASDVDLTDTGAGFGGQLWSHADGTPVSDVAVMSDNIEAKTGFRPNAMLVGRKTYTALRNSDDIMGLISGGATTVNPALVNAELIARALDIENLYVMSSVVTTTGDAADANFINQEGALLYYTEANGSLRSRMAINQFVWNTYLGTTNDMGIAIRRFRNEERRSLWVEGETAYDMKVIASALGNYIANTV